MIILKEDIINLILQAEKEYHNKLKKAVTEAEKYADDCKKKQGAIIDEMQEEWYSFEKAENEKLKNALYEDEQKMEIEMAKSKEQLKIRQIKKADLISDRLKEEVLSLYDN